MAGRAGAIGLHVLCLGWQCGDWESTVEAFNQTKAEHGNIDVLVNNAGITRDRMFVKMTPDDWKSVIETNLNSMFNVTKQVVADMVEKGWGRIINISSVNGAKGQAGQTNYSAAKAGMHGFTMALAQEMAAKGVTVNTVSPGYIGTDMVKAIRPDVLERSWRACPSSVWASLQRLPPSSPGWLRKRAAIPPALTLRSTAVCTCIKPVQAFSKRSSGSFFMPLALHCSPAAGKFGSVVDKTRRNHSCGF